MPTEKLGYAEILADLETKRSVLDAVIANLRTLLTMGALGQVGDVELSPSLTNGSTLPAMMSGGPVDLPTGAFLGKSLPASIKIYLAAAKRKQTTREIATALREGGIESTSSNFENIVIGALNRLKAAGDVLRFKDGWGLAEFYPESLRNRIAQDAKPKAKKKPSTKPAKATKPRKGARGMRTPATRKPDAPSLDSRILDALRKAPATPAALSAALGAQSNIVGLALGRLAFKDKVTKQADGTYTLPDDAEPVLRAV